MNFKKRNEERKRLRDLFRTNYPQGTVKITAGESEIHARVKMQICHYLLSQGYEVWTECNLTGFNGRPDIVCLHKNGTSCYIIEIISSESEKSIIEKGQIYPIPIIPVIAKTFDYSKFKL